MLAIDIVSELMEEHVPKVVDTINVFMTAGRQQSSSWKVLKFCFIYSWSRKKALWIST
jgi:hypothetical protein